MMPFRHLLVLEREKAKQFASDLIVAVIKDFSLNAFPKKDYDEAKPSFTATSRNHHGENEPNSGGGGSDFLIQTLLVQGRTRCESTLLCSADYVAPRESKKIRGDYGTSTSF